MPCELCRPVSDICGHWALRSATSQLFVITHYRFPVFVWPCMCNCVCVLMIAALHCWFHAWMVEPPAALCCSSAWSYPYGIIYFTRAPHFPISNNFRLIFSLSMSCCCAFCLIVLLQCLWGVHKSLTKKYGYCITVLYFRLFPIMNDRIHPFILYNEQSWSAFNRCYQVIGSFLSA